MIYPFPLIMPNPKLRFGSLFYASAFESELSTRPHKTKKANPSGWLLAFIRGSGEIRTLVQIRKK
jgi:hypothetical protein